MLTRFADIAEIESPLSSFICSTMSVALVVFRSSYNMVDLWIGGCAYRRHLSSKGPSVTQPTKSTGPASVYRSLIENILAMDYLIRPPAALRPQTNVLALAETSIFRFYLLNRGGCYPKTHRSSPKYVAVWLSLLICFTCGCILSKFQNIKSDFPSYLEAAPFLLFLSVSWF